VAQNKDGRDLVSGLHEVREKFYKLKEFLLLKEKYAPLRELHKES